MQERDACIINLRNKGTKQIDIANQVGCSLNIVKNVCRKYAITEQQDRTTEEQAVAICSKAGLEYVSGFVNTHSKIIVRCKVCGNEYERMFHIIRKQVDGVYPCEPQCANCLKIATNKRKAQREQQKAIREQLLIQNKELKRSLKVNEGLLYLMESRTCKNCNQKYCIQATGYDSIIYCSSKCQKRYLYRMKNDKRNAIIKSRKHDSDITLEKLYNKERGICYLCGKQCDWQDITEHDGTLIAGNSYPSIDHVTPISKGGTHTWDNIRLACRKCNTIKSAS